MTNAVFNFFYFSNLNFFCLFSLIFIHFALLPCRYAEKDYLLEKFNYNNKTLKAYKMDVWRTATFGYLKMGAEPQDPPPDPEPEPEPILTPQQIAMIYLEQNWFFIVGIAAVVTAFVAVRRRSPIRQYTPTASTTH